jgi:hypothetical protein
MAHFYGTLKGSRGEATRCGTKSSGVQVTAASWSGAVTVELYHNAETGQDMAHVYLRPWHGRGTDLALYSGPVNPDSAVQPRPRKEVA